MLTPAEEYTAAGIGRPYQIAPPGGWPGLPSISYADGRGAEGGRLDAGKTRVDLLPPDALMAVGEVLAVGANKYADRNWEKGMKWGRVVGSMLRHTFKRMLGETHDPETKLRHSAHIACNALFLLTYEIRGVGEDDLPKKVGIDLT